MHTTKHQDKIRRAGQILLIDGGLASELERAGCDLGNSLWSARALLEAPAAIEAAHLAFLRAGADVIITATYQATFEGFAARGIAHGRTRELLHEAVRIAMRARDRLVRQTPPPPGSAPPRIAASIGPYGAYLADGSEYRGDYPVGMAALERFHRERLQILAKSGVDLLACETIPSLAEARLLAGLVAMLPGAPPAWFTFTCRDEAHLSDGTPIGEVAAWAERTAAVDAVGINCTPAALVTPLVRALAAGTGKTILAYPNGGGAWDAGAKRWQSADPAIDWGDACLEWVAAGAGGVGGCCRVGPEAIRAMREALNRRV